MESTAGAEHDKPAPARHARFGPGAENNTPGAETMAPTPAKESDGATARVGAVAAAVIAVVALL